MKRYNYGYKGDEWGMNVSLQLIEHPTGQMVYFSDAQKAIREAKPVICIDFMAKEIQSLMQHWNYGFSVHTNTDNAVADYNKAKRENEAQQLAAIERIIRKHIKKI